MRSILFAATAALALAGGTAQAQDVNTPWSGWYLGITAGSAFDGNTTVTDTGVPSDWNVAGDTWSFDTDGLAAGIRLGYDHALEGVVIGGALEFLYSDISGSAATPTSVDTFGATEADWLVLLTARLGFNPFPEGLIYVEGGLASGELNRIVFDRLLVPGGGLMEGSTDDGNFGWALGGGVEFLVDANIVFGIDYRYIDFGEETVVGIDAGLNEYNFNHEFDVHLVRATLTFALD